MVRDVDNYNIERGSGLQPSESVYAVMVKDILEAVGQGRLKPNDRLPTESQLKQQYGISVTSVRRGIDTLVKDGIVERRQGSGTYIKQIAQALDKPVRKDSIALISTISLSAYHPFFSEMFDGIRRELTDLGWKIYEYAQEHGFSSYRDISAYHIDVNEANLKLRRHPEIAGALVGATLVDKLQAWHEGECPIVALDISENCPFVAYDWIEESVKAIKSVLAKGARKIWVCSGLDEAELTGRLGDEALHGGREFFFHRSSSGTLLSEVVSDAFHATLRAFDENPDIDGIVIGSDYETKGVMDGLFRLGSKVSPKLVVSAIVNRQSNIVPSSFSTTFFVADGYKKGQSLARLLNARILDPAKAARKIILSTDIEEY